MRSATAAARDRRSPLFVFFSPGWCAGCQVRRRASNALNDSSTKGLVRFSGTVSLQPVKEKLWADLAANAPLYYTDTVRPFSLTDPRAARPTRQRQTQAYSWFN